MGPAPMMATGRLPTRPVSSGRAVRSSSVMALLFWPEYRWLSMSSMDTVSIDVNIDYHRSMTILAVTDVSAANACCTPLVREPLSVDEAEELSHTLKALADPARLRLLSIVAASA